MAPRRAHLAAIAAASDGSILLNVADLLPAAVLERVGKALGHDAVFIGVPLTQREAGEVVGRLDGAAAEASARLLAGRTRKPSKIRPRARR